MTLNINIIIPYPHLPFSVLVVSFLIIFLSRSCKSATTELENPVVINKCCDLNQYYNIETKACEPTGSQIPIIWPVLQNFSETNKTFNVTFNPESRPKCSKELTMVKIHKDEHLYSTPQYFLDEAGVLRETTFNDIFNSSFQLHHAQQHYCIDPLEDSIIFLVCPPLCNEEEPCYRKCCPRGRHYNWDEDYCEPSALNKGHIFQLPEFPLYDHPHQLVRNTSKANPRITTGTGEILNCPWEDIVRFSTGWSFVESELPFKILTNGSIVGFFKSKQSWQTLDKPVDYCVEQYHSEDENEEVLCHGELDVLLMCLQNEPESLGNGTNSLREIITPKTKGKSKTKSLQFVRWLEILAKVTLIIALVCLFLTAIIIFLLIDSVNIHSWTRLSFVTSELIFLFIFALARSSWHKSLSENPGSCKAFAMIFHYAGLMTMCWLSVINFDLWWTFKVLKPSGSKKFDVGRFICYASFAQGAPLLVILIGLGIQQTKPSLAEHICRKDVNAHIELANSKVIYPDYGLGGACSIFYDSLGAYWYGPLCFLMFANLVFFLATTYRMKKLRRMTRRASLGSTGAQRGQSYGSILQ